MASWVLATEAFPIFGSKNYLNQDTVDYGTFTATEMQALLERVIDGDPFSQWVGSSSSDLTSVVLTFSFNEGSTLCARTPDLIILQNINWKNFVVEWSTNGTTWSTVSTLNYADGVADNAATDIIVNPSDVILAKYLRITITKTITADAKKRLGGLIVCSGVVQLSMGFLDFQVDYYEPGTAEIELGDGSLSHESTPRSATSDDFWGAKFDCPFAARSELLLLRGIKRGGEPFILIMEPGDNKGEAYLCHFVGRWGHEYENPVRPAGFAIPMKVREVGSH
jgi:hypothetical protein